MKIDPELRQLIQEAQTIGASDAAIISSREIIIKNELAALCNGEYICPNYGLSTSCPPYVEGPVEFRKWQTLSKYSITVKIELPTTVMFSDERKGVMQLLHHIVSTVEKKAIEMEFRNSKGFAGGSCKELFCDDHKNCRVLIETKPCRHKEIARPSMSGFGIDVIQLMKLSGWSDKIAEDQGSTDQLSWVAGLILIA